MPKAGYCSGCGRHVWLRDDGSCENGHAPDAVSNAYVVDEAPPPLPPADPERGRPSSLAVLAAVALAVAVLAALGFGLNPFESRGTNEASPAGSEMVEPSLSPDATLTPRPILEDEAQLAAKPDDYALLKRLGDAYYDFAQSQRRPSGSKVGTDQPLWAKAARYYGRALAVRPGDPGVRTDMAISQFYSGEASEALKSLETVRRESPTFAPAAFNVGLMCLGLGRDREAVDALRSYLRLDPEGQYAATARFMLEQLQAHAAKS